ncbi:MAG: MBL fold metallo-hydrolase [Candidatus Nomurabacteria bacterium]|nr:MBL fold metallo-hydrolase [Candidatus Nomurabacteria bacterium]
MLTFAALDIGQGDGLFIESPSGVQMLVDGGPIHSILAPLSKVMPLYDKHIDAIMITNPDADHIGGFIDILKNYDVDYIIEPGTFNPSKTYATVEQLVLEKHVKKIIARRGMKLNLGAGAYINILFPDRDVSTWSPNDGSIVARLSYGNNSVMLTGDATQKTEGIILGENHGESARLLKSTILKVGHHGSRTSSSSAFVQAVAPTYAVISDGRDNKYGHPHQETLNTLNSFNIKILRTDLLGTIIFKGDGKLFTQSK